MLDKQTLKDALAEIMLDQGLINRIAHSKREAQIRDDADRRPRWVSRVTLDLTTAVSFNDKDAKILAGEPFDAIYIEDATDDTTSIKVAYTSPELYQTANYQTLKKNDSMSFEKSVKQAILSWDAQSGKSITLIFFIGARFQSGSFRQVLSGGVSVTTGSAITPVAPVTVTSAATSIVAASSTRKRVTLQLATGSPAIWIASVNTLTAEGGATPGIQVSPGDTYEYDGQGALYGITAGGSATVQINTEA